jgi:S1-C subfamily serine protease
MSDSQDKKDIDQKPAPEASSEASPLANTEFMREKIKQRPINRKKLLRRTIITVSLAAVFGLVACITFLILEPVINNALYPEEKPKTVSFPEESASDELQPEQMYANEAAIEAQAAASAQYSAEVSTEKEVQQAISSYSFDASDYSEMYTSLHKTAVEASKSIVTVTGVTSDTDWINDAYEKSGSESGLIVADNGTETLVLVNVSAIQKADSIQVTFCNNTTVKAKLKMKDATTGLCILSIQNTAITKDTKSAIATADLGSSDSASLAGIPVIAIGSPTGIQGSICYGMITSGSRILDLRDSAYRLLSTNIYGSPSGSGALVNLTGQVIGIINMTYNNDNYTNQVSAYGITELKTLIATLSNGTEYAYLGVHGTDVPDYVSDDTDIPKGAYITQIEMKSPAMEAGIQSGDVIISFDGSTVSGYDDLIDDLLSHKPDDEIRLVIMRQGPDDYTRMNLNVTLGSSKSDS